MSKKGIEERLRETLNELRIDSITRLREQYNPNDVYYVKLEEKYQRNKDQLYIEFKEFPELATANYFKMKK